MALNAYLSRTQALLQNPSAPTSLYDPALLIIYINEARVQLAGESESIKVIGTFTTSPNNQGPYPWSSITLIGATAVQGVLDVRMLRYTVLGGQAPVAPRPWPWFQQYDLGVAGGGPPIEWAQYGEGVNGTLYIFPPPDTAYPISADCICYPIPLADDTTIEAIPALWTTAIPYYAAYLALLQAQTGARAADAEKMFALYQLFVQRARRFVTPDVLPMQYPQAAQASTQPAQR